MVKIIKFALFSVLIIIFIRQGLIAQKVEYKTVAITYTQYPYKKLLNNPETISLQIKEFHNGVHYSTYFDFQKNNLNTNNLAQVTNGGDIEILVGLQGLSLKSKELIIGKRTKKVGDKNVEIPTYHYDIGYSYPYEIVIYNKVNSNEVLASDVVANSKLGFRTTSFDSKSELNNYWNTNKNTFFAKEENSATSLVSKVINDFLHTYCEMNLKRSVNILMPKPKKHQYDDYQNAYNEVVKGFKELSNSNIENARLNIEKAIDIWQEAIKEVQLKNRKARVTEKIAYETFLNCAKVCIWINEFEEAKSYINEANNMRKKGLEKNGKNLSSLINNRLVRLDFNDIEHN